MWFWCGGWKCGCIWMEVEVLGFGNRFFKRSDVYIFEVKEVNKDFLFVKVMIKWGWWVFI